MASGDAIPNKFYMLLLSIAIGGTGANGIYSVKTRNETIQHIDDRYRARDATKDFAIRDIRIAYNTQTIADLKKQIDRIDESHPPPELVRSVRELRDRIRIIERHIDAENGPH